MNGFDRRFRTGARAGGWMMLGALCAATAATGAAQDAARPLFDGLDPGAAARRGDGAPGGAAAGVPHGGGAGSRADDLIWTRPAGAIAQDGYADGDRYSARTLFREAHSEFLQNWEGFRPEVMAVYRFRPDTEIQSEPGSFDENDFEVRARAPRFAVAPDTFIEPEFRYRARVFEFSQGFQGSREDETLHEVVGVFRVGHFVTDDLMLLGEYSIGIYSDIDRELNQRDWQSNGSVLGVYRVQPDLMVQGGIVVAQDFEDARVYPAFGVVWLFAPRWRVDVLAPQHARIEWNPIDRLFLNAQLWLSGRQYNRRQGRAQAFWQTQDVRLTAGAAWRFTDALSAHVNAGSTIFGDNEFRGPSVLGQSNGQLEPRLYFDIGFGLNF